MQQPKYNPQPLSTTERAHGDTTGKWFTSTLTISRSPWQEWQVRLQQESKSQQPKPNSSKRIFYHFAKKLQKFVELVHSVESAQNPEVGRPDVVRLGGGH